MNRWSATPVSPSRPRLAALRYESLPVRERRALRVMTMAEVVERWGVWRGTAAKWKRLASKEFSR